MKNNREEIEQIKKDFRKRLESDVNFLKSGIIRELDYLMRNNQDKDLNILVEEASKKLKFQGSSKIKLINEVKETQLKIATVWKEYFSSVTDSKYLNDGNYEKMLSVYNVDFNTLEEKTRQTVTREISKSINNEYSYDIVRTNLIRSGIGTNEAYTLANTAVSQFDNASMFEYSKQAGIEKFKYSGILNHNSRQFCKDHFGKIYTLEEIRAMDNGQGLPVLTSCGGYNCTHYWEAIVELFKSNWN